MKRALRILSLAVVLFVALVAPAESFMEGIGKGIGKALEGLFK